MKLRLASLAVAAVAAAGSAGSALAGYSSPKIVVLPPSGGSQTFELSQDPNDDATAKLQVFAAHGYGLTLPGGVVGTQIGTVDATLVLLQAGGASAHATGTVVVVDPSVYMQAAGSCTGKASHDAVWLLRLTASGVTFDVPGYVDRASGSQTSYASLQLQVCLPPPDVPASMGGAPLGAKLVRAKVTVNGVFTSAPAGSPYRWTSVWTPWFPVIGLPDTSSSVEAQSIVQQGKVTIAAKRIAVKRGKKKVYFAKVSGKLTADGEPVAGVRVEVGDYDPKKKRAKRHVVFATTGTAGTYAATVALRRTTLFGAEAVVRAGSVDPPVCMPNVPIGPFSPACASVTTSGFDVARVGVLVKLPRR